MLRRVLLPFVLIVLQLAAAAQAQVTLERKYPEGAAGKLKETQVVDQTLTLAGMDLVTKSEVAMVHAYQNETPNDDGQPIKVTTESMNVTITLPMGMGQIQFDSANANAKATNPQYEVFMEMFRAMNGSSITYTIGKDNRVASVDGQQEILRQASQGAAELLKGELTAERLSADFNRSLDAIPSTPLNMGDTWTRTEVMSLGQGQTMTFDRRYEYAGTVTEGGRQLERITGTDEKVRFSIDANSALPLSVKSSDLKVESSKIEIFFDRESGAVIGTVDDVHIKGELNLTIMGNDLPGKLDLTISRGVVPVQ